MCYLEVFVFKSLCILGFSSYFSIIDSKFSSLMVEEQTLHDLYIFKYVQVCFMSKNVFYSCEYSMRRMCFLLLGEVVCRCQSFLVDGGDELTYVHTNCLPARSAHLCESCIDVPNYGSGFFYFSLQFH